MRWPKISPNHLLRYNDTNLNTSVADRQTILFILAAQLIVIEAGGMMMAIRVHQSAIGLVAIFLFSAGILIVQRNALLSLVLITTGSAMFAAIIGGAASNYSTVVACCAATAVACATVRESAVAGMIFAVIVMNSDAAWSLYIFYYTLFQRPQADVLFAQGLGYSLCSRRCTHGIVGVYSRLRRCRRLQ